MNPGALYQSILIGQACAIGVWLIARALGIFFNNLLREAFD